LAPGVITTNDIVSTFKGGLARYILRPIHGVHYILIVESYVRRAMNGEAMDMDLTEHKFNIR